MLERTFLHIPGVGPKRERDIWHDGILSWNAMMLDRDLFDQAPPPQMQQEITPSRQNLSQGNARWFEERLGPSLAWRLSADFDDGRIAYLDIETDGSTANHIAASDDAPGGTTVCAIWDGIQAKVFLRDHDLHLIPQ